MCATEAIASRAATILANVNQLAEKAGHHVNLIAVSKTRSAEEVRQAYSAGLTAFGENFLQDALPKISALTDLNATWHFIGRVQSNKTADIARCFDWVHTVDRTKIADRLNRHRAGKAPLNVLIQVNVDGDSAKGGVPADDHSTLTSLTDAIQSMENLRVRGLMTMLAKTTDPQAGYGALRALFDQHASAADWDTLSMGMTADYAEAIACGSTHVRIGTAIFGPRLTSKE